MTIMFVPAVSKATIGIRKHDHAQVNVQTSILSAQTALINTLVSIVKVNGCLKMISQHVFLTSNVVKELHWMLNQLVLQLIKTIIIIVNNVSKVTDGQEPFVKNVTLTNAHHVTAPTVSLVRRVTSSQPMVQGVWSLLTTVLFQKQCSHVD